MKKFVVALMLALALCGATEIEVFSPDTAYAAAKKKAKSSKKKKTTKKKSTSKKKSSKQSSGMEVYQCIRCGDTMRVFPKGMSEITDMNRRFNEAMGYGPAGKHNCAMGGYCIWRRVR